MQISPKAEVEIESTTILHKAIPGHQSALPLEYFFFDKTLEFWEPRHTSIIFHAGPENIGNN